MKADEIEVGGYYEGRDGLVRKVAKTHRAPYSHKVTEAHFEKVAGPKGRHWNGSARLDVFARWARRRLTPAEVGQVERGRAAEKDGQG